MLDLHKEGRQVVDMRIQDVIQAPKENLTVSDWGTGKAPKNKFPLSKAGRKAWSFGRAWQWRFAEFDANGRRFVVRLLFCEDKDVARMHLGWRTDRDTVVLCCYEFHADLETGWHLHTLCGERNDLERAPTGTVVHGPWVKRLPDAHVRHRRKTFNRDAHGGLRAWLWSETVRFFKLDGEDVFR